jgi:hypothetical protein
MRRRIPFKKATFTKSEIPRASEKIFENTLPLQEKDLLYFGSDENIGIHRGTPERSRCSNLATEPGDSPRIPQNFSFPRFQRF